MQKMFVFINLANLKFRWLYVFPLYAQNKTKFKKSFFGKLQQKICKKYFFPLFKQKYLKYQGIFKECFYKI